MPKPEGFLYTQRSDGSVVITHHGRTATVLRGRRAAAFLDELSPDEIDSGDDQLVMARWTGNYKRGNERMAKQHPRNRR